MAYPNITKQKVPLSYPFQCMSRGVDDAGGVRARVSAEQVLRWPGVPRKHACGPNLCVYVWWECSIDIIHLPCTQMPHTRSHPVVDLADSCTEKP